MDFISRFLRHHQKAFFLFIGLTILIGVVRGQQIGYDTIGRYSNGTMVDEWRNRIYEKTLEGKTIFLQEKFENGQLIREYSRLNDSTYLYSEYKPENAGRTTFGMQLLKQGSVVISGITSDTFLIFDPSSYDDEVHFDTLLLPVGSWKTLHLNGEIASVGSYVNYKRHGEWQYFDEDNKLLEMVHYERGEKKFSISPETMNKGVVEISKSYNELYLHAQMKLDHHFFGYAAPDTSSEKLILFSIFTSEVKNNPHKCYLGAYYDTQGMEGMKIEYIGDVGDFIKMLVRDPNGRCTFVFFKRIWIELN